MERLVSDPDKQRRDVVDKEILRSRKDAEANQSRRRAGWVIDGRPLTEAEFNISVIALRERKQLKGTLFSDNDLRGLIITPEGREALSSGLAPSDFHSRQNIGGIINNDNRYSINNSGTMGTVATGKNVKQSGNTFHNNESNALREKIAELQAKLNEIDNVPASLTAELIEFEAEAALDTPDKSKLKELGSSFVGQIMSNAADTAYAGLIAAAASLPTLLSGF